jgi:hypothetical protein
LCLSQPKHALHCLSTAIAFAASLPLHLPLLHCGCSTSAVASWPLLPSCSFAAVRLSLPWVLLLHCCCCHAVASLPLLLHCLECFIAAASLPLLLHGLCFPAVASLPLLLDCRCLGCYCTIADASLPLPHCCYSIAAAPMLPSIAAALLPLLLWCHCSTTLRHPCCLRFFLNGPLNAAASLQLYCSCFTAAPVPLQLRTVSLLLTNASPQQCIQSRLNHHTSAFSSPQQCIQSIPQADKVTTPLSG